MKTEVSVKVKVKWKYKILAINTCPVAVLQFGAWVLEWRKDELMEMYRKNRILMNGALNPKSDTNKTYLPRQKVG